MAGGKQVAHYGTPGGRSRTASGLHVTKIEAGCPSPFTGREECRVLLWGLGGGGAISAFSSWASRGACRLRRGGSPERDGSPTGTFPTERSGSRQERRVWVKRSRSSVNASCSACWARTGPLSEAPESSDSDVSCVEIKAVQARCCTELRWSTDTSSSPFRGLRI